MKKQAKSNNKRSVARRTLHYYFEAVKEKKWVFIIVVIASAICTGISFGATYLLAQVVDILTTHNLTAKEVLPTFSPIILLYASILAVRVVINNISFYFFWKSEIDVKYFLAQKVYDKVVSQSTRFHNDRFSGSIVSQTNKFVNGSEKLIDTIFFNIYEVLLDVTFAVVILAPLVPAYVICLAIFIIIFVVLSYKYFSKIRPLNDRLAESQNKQSGQLSDSISNIATVKAYAKEKFEKIRFAKYSHKVQTNDTILAKTVMIRSGVFQTVSLFIQVAVLVFIIGSSTWFDISVGTIILMVTYTTTVMNSLWSFDKVMRNLNDAFGDAREMTLILDEANEVVDAPNAKKLALTGGAIDIEDMTFQHAQAGDVLFKNFNLKIPAGQRVGLVGKSGSGKTTLTKLLLRLMDIDAGEILIDNQNIAKITQQSLRENIAYVPQETILFHRSIAENIAYGKPNATREEIIRAAKLANAWEFIETLPDGLDTLTGERGVKLSGGQRQRVAIARAILKDAPILIMDEATASLDTESEKLIQEAMGRLMQGRTCIVIAHRLSTVAELDRVVVLENGEIVEDGTHQKLLRDDGVYAKLWNKQSGVIDEN